MVRVAINGLGRVGRLVFRRLFYLGGRLGMGADLAVVNDLEDPKILVHLLQYDTTHGQLKAVLPYQESEKRIRGEFGSSYGTIDVLLTATREIEKLPWRENKIDVVVEATGVFTKRADLEKHLGAGAKKVILTAPAATGEDVDLTMVMGVNEGKYDPAKHHLISNASCTTNCLAPVAKVLHERFGIVKGWVSTIHAYTNDQRLLDLVHKDLRRARAAGENFLPNTTGAARAIGLVMPELAGKLDGAAWRVPVKDVSSIDLVVEVERATTIKEVNWMLKDAALDSQVLRYTEEKLVSSDYIGNAFSAVVDAECTRVLGGNLVRVVAWYDNEWGYSCRVVDLIQYIAKKGL